ncbi:MAG: hypothetical protein KGL39_04135 [Patescibacteria group bacterium]|nr:hypothetical protein [Patescibacteria group bacterium]
MSAAKKAAKLERQLTDTLDALHLLLRPSAMGSKVTVLHDLLRRASIPAKTDGFSAGRQYGDLVSTSTTSDPVFGAAASLIGETCSKCQGGTFTHSDGSKRPCRKCRGTGTYFADPVRENVSAIVDHLLVIIDTARMVNRKRAMVLEEATSQTGRVTSLQGSCTCCARFVVGTQRDRLRGGLCEACNSAWRRWLGANATPDPGSDKIRFVTERQAWLREQDEKSRLDDELGMNAPTFVQQAQ